MIYYFHNQHTLADQLVNFIFFNNISDFLVKNCIYVYYYCPSEYIYVDHIDEFKNCANVYVFDLKQKPNHSFELSCENNKAGETMNQVKNRNNGKVCYDMFYKCFFNNVMRKHNIPLKFQSMYYSDTDLYQKFESLPDKYKNVDILILDSNETALGFDRNKWEHHIQTLNKHYKLVTTTKFTNIVSTKDDNLSLKMITAIATHASIIISINSDIIFSCLNDQTLKYAKQIILFDDHGFFSYPTFTNKKCIDDISLNYIETILPKRKEEIKAITPEDSEELKKKYKNFDWKFYIYFNADLEKIEGEPANEITAWRHFVNHGIQEKRIYSFDWVKYISDNNLQDVAHNKEEAFKHLSRNNNRDLYMKQSSFVDDEEACKLKMFDWQYYVSIHPDLHNINNYEDALNHYIQHGKKENRPISDFNWMDYLMLNRDLIDSGIVNETHATRHWARHGKQEGRKYKVQNKMHL